MTTWHEHIEARGAVPEWPYPICYGETDEVEADVLIVGGGVAGCHAAVAAAKKGVKVVVIEKGATKRSGSGGTGVDHWHAATTNPCSRVPPEDYTRAIVDSAGGYACGPARYIDAMESWDALLDCEGMGVQIRDEADEFTGADFRDDATKLMFAYDYENRIVVRVWGHNIKPALYREMKRLGVVIYDRMVATSLLTEGGQRGTRVIGATAVSVRTGAFMVIRSKATIVSTGTAIRLWAFAPEMTNGAMRDLNNAGVGQAIGWNAGAEFVEMEHCRPAISGLGYAPYSMGNTSNTYHGVPIVDANGKAVPWLDIHGKEVTTERARFRPTDGQKFMLGIGIGIYSYLNEFRLNDLPGNMPERIRNGEYALPLYADLTRLSEAERHCIFGMMVGNEGKTRIPIYDQFTKAGFDPDKDLLQAPVMIPEGYGNTNYWSGTPYPAIRGLAGGGYLVDWDLRTSLEGLYSAGLCLFGCGAHASAAVSGRYTGRKAAEYAQSVSASKPEARQVDAEKGRVYTAVRKENRNGVGWKELNYAISRLMADYCGKYKNEMTLTRGLDLMKQLRENEAESAYAANPHELGRLLECLSLITCGEIVMHASRVRRASSAYLDHYRLDYPDLDPADWHKLLPIRLEGDNVQVRDLPLDYHLKAPYAPSYEENYRRRNPA